MTSTLSDVQKIVVTLSETDVAIVPGGTAQLVVTMTNRQDTPDRLSLEIEGIDVEWYAIPVPAVNVGPGAQASERVLFKVGRSSENRAGAYPFLVRVQAMETGEVGVAQATLHIKPFNALQLELNPKRAVTTYFSRHNDFEVSISNQGNSEETLDLYANDPEDGCAYEFDTDRVTLKPGQSQVIPLTIGPKVSTIIGGIRLYGFTVSTRSVTDSYVSATAHGQLEKRALISPLLGIFLLLLAFGSLGAYAFWPRPAPPILIKAFNASQKKVKADQEVTLTWDISPPDSKIIIFKQSKADSERVALPGEWRNAVYSIPVKPEPPETTYTLVVRSHGKEKFQSLTIDVTPPPAAPKPTLTFFKADPPKIHQGETTMLSWEAHGHTNILLDPGSVQLSKFVQSHQLTLDQDTTFTLRVFGADEKVKPASKTVTVTVVPKNVCLAEVTSFALQPGADAVYIGDKARLKWQTRYARTARIDSDRGPLGEVTPRAGSTVVEVTEPITFTLTVTDSAGNTATKTLSVTPKPRPLPETPPETLPEEGAPPPSSGNTPSPGTPPNR